MTEVFQDTYIIPAKPLTCRVAVEPHALTKLPEHLDAAGLEGRVFLITDTTVSELYGERILEDLEAGNVEAEILVMPEGEANKTLAQAGIFAEQLAERKATRRDIVIALGGGVVGDTAGFTASIYNRGVPLVQVPTTLLAAVDSSVGGKTAVDHGGKNKVGTFYQPSLVVADPSVLATLEARAYRQGLAEIAKYGMLDASFMEELEPQAENIRDFSVDYLDVLKSIIQRCIGMKMGYVVKDPHEEMPDVRVMLNYGHSLAHGLEAASKYGELYHGEAVAIGMNYAALLSTDLLDEAEPELFTCQKQLLEKLGLPTRYDGSASADEILEHMARDKKNNFKGRNRLVLPVGIGQMVVKQVENEVVEASVRAFLASA